MNREEIIRMAREVGMQGMLTDVVTTIDELERFVALVEERAAAAEREACAKVMEIFDKAANTGGCIASAIRARGNK
jgi:hypothetical protein